MLGTCDEELWADSHWWECLYPWVSRTVSTQSEAWGLENQDLALSLCLCTRVWLWELEGSAFKVPRDMMASEGPPQALDLISEGPLGTPERMENKEPLPSHDPMDLWSWECSD